MSTPTNGAARNTMSEFERQCYDWGWQDNEDRIIKILESIRVGDNWIGRDYAIELIKGDNK